MEYQVRVTESAIEDINLILTNLKENTLSTKIVQDAEEKIKNKIISLKYFPKRNKVVEFEEFKSMGLRRALVDPYAIFFAIYEDIVYVIAVCYGASDIETILSSKK